jgi:hypothetical protein
MVSSVRLPLPNPPHKGEGATALRCSLSSMASLSPVGGEGAIEFGAGGQPTPSPLWGGLGRGLWTDLERGHGSNEGMNTCQ